MSLISNLKPIKTIGIVCQDGSKISPVITILLRSYAIKSSKKHVRDIQMWNASINPAKHIKNSTISFLQKKGIKTYQMIQMDHVSKNWISAKDVVLTADKFIKKKLIYDYSIAGIELKSKIFTLPEILNQNIKLRDPGDDASSDNSDLFENIDDLCSKLIKLLEKI